MAQQSDSLTGLVRGALDDVRDLIREEVALARAEMRYEVGKVTSAGVQFGVAGVSLWFAALFVLVAAALGIAQLLAWPAWAGFVTMGVLLGIIGLVAAMSGRRAVREVQPLPRTVGTIKETFQ